LHYDTIPALDTVCQMDGQTDGHVNNGYYSTMLCWVLWQLKPTHIVLTWTKI